MSGRAAARVTLLLGCFVVVQQTLVLDVRIGGVHPDVMVLLPIAAGIVGGPARGAVMGFVAGLVADLFLPTPFGLSAFVGCLVGYAVGRATAALDRSAWWLPLLAAIVASGLYEAVYALVGALLGQQQLLHTDLSGIIAMVAAGNALLAVPAVRLVSWALPEASVEGMPGATSTLSGIR